MDLDELKAKWAEQDRKLETSIRLNREILRTMRTNRARTELQWLIPSLAVESILDFVIVTWLGNFIYEHIASPQFAIPAVALDLMVIALMVALIWQIVTIAQLDYDQPVAQIQKQLAMLRTVRIGYIQWILILGPLAWTPLLIISMKALLGLDAYRIFGLVYLTANVLVGVVILLLAIWFSKQFGRRLGRTPFVQYLADTLAGYRLKAALGFLTTLSDFVKE